MAYTQIYYHIIFRTKYSRKSINLNNSDELYRYISGIIKSKKGVLYRINGMEDHIHILSSLHPTIALSDFIKDIKVASSGWAKESGLFPQFEGWAKKYAAFTCSIYEKDSLIEYIRNQREHHKKETFQEEIRRIWKEYDIQIDEKWFWEEN